MTTKRNSDETEAPKGSPVDADHAAGYPKDAATHLTGTNETDPRTGGLPVGPEFDASFPTYEFDEPAK